MIESADHPRSRGVYRRATGLPPAPHGSSPLARGLRALGFHPDSWVRIIPARAGFTKLDLVKILVVVDHPRSRGVYPVVPDPHRRIRGSSPLARGLQSIMRPEWTRAGIIPARAGFTRGFKSRQPDRRDHPRSRGVYVELGAWKHEGNGSSPLARGLRGGGGGIAGHRGIIPARAGFTPCRWDAATMGNGKGRPGSSPLARGLRSGARLDRGGGGIIPARAGFTIDSARRIFEASGSSPLARGLPGPLSVGGALSRIIPARAGFTCPRAPRG